MKHSGRPWSDDEEARLIELRKSGMLAVDIATELCRTVESVKACVKRKRFPCLPRKKRSPSPLLQYSLIAEKTVVPQSVLDDRNRRYSAQYADLTGMLFGDPPVGFRAVDRRTA